MLQSIQIIKHVKHVQEEEEEKKNWKLNNTKIHNELMDKFENAKNGK